MSVDRLAPSHLADRYLLSDLIAAGGMGEVFLATDERLARQVAVKVLSRALTDSPEAVERFRREALTSARLAHPNIARVYDYGVDGDTHFIVMEYLPGQSLDRLIRERGRLSPGEAVDIATQVCAALGAAHHAGLVHRDVKPGNVIVTPEGTVKVTDFGIAKALGSAALTDAGTVLGTAAYLAPEVSLGRPAVPASDLYSLGIVLFQMVTGQVPFSGETAVTVAMKHISDDVPAPSRIDPELPRFLDRVVARATAMRPEDRYASADEMAAALRAGDAPLLESTQAMPAVQAPVPTAPATRAIAPAVPATRAMAPAVPATQAMAPAVPAAQAMSPAVPLTATAALPAAAAPPSRRDQHPDDDRQSTRPRRPGRVLAGLAALVVIALVAVGATLLLNGRPNPSTATPPAQTHSSTTSPTTTATSQAPSGPSGVVPDGLVGSDLSSAVQAITTAGLSYKWQMVASDAPRNQVLSATPDAGQTLSKGDTVQLVISRGPGTDTNASSANNTQSGNTNDQGNGNKGKGHGKGKGGN